MKRTNIDWSKHEVIVTEQEELLVHDFKIPNSSTHRVRFINTNGILAVNGDFGNWIFCREFHPSAEGAVSDGYWIEKLRNSSCQEPSKYDGEITTQRLKEAIADIDGELEDNPQDAYYLKKKEYYENLLQYTDDYYEYIQEARDYPDGMDSEDIIVGKELNPWLVYVFDAFDEICLRLKNQNEHNN